MIEYDFAELWRLPGPGSYVREVARLARGGQHVLAIVPKYIADNAEYSNALSVAIANQFDDSKRVLPSADQGHLSVAFGFEVSYDFDEFPTTVDELITHNDVVGRTFICNAADLDAEHIAELPNFLRRLDIESRLVARSDRGTMVFVVGREHAPDDTESVATARLWYWDRITRWDVAALVAHTLSARSANGVIAEVRLETIVELARWDFMLAVDMADSWTDDESGPETLLAQEMLEILPHTPIRRSRSGQPPEAFRDEWDRGVVEAWHGEPCYKPAALSSAGGRHDRLVWSAQARVLMPWIEVRRVRVERIVREKLGPSRMDAAIDEFATRFPAIDNDSSTVEIATLARIISARFGNTEPRLRATARALRKARNRLSHLEPLTQAAIGELVSECAWLAS
ncbi:hypothetical protein [Agromyces larvae]|uniref:ApeA N-terminal domain-containing protein n=1 Tax=Agromyces larvae TaxID=2929802 RepID=A0ABY4C2P3_9MICO|nr:hypothetical protein [Agromyces larvae]UOE45589.1 hypothetical protein MTO99_07515 [Agromyces larvae]